MLLVFPADGRWQDVFSLEAARRLLVIGRGSASCWYPRGMRGDNLSRLFLCTDTLQLKKNVRPIPRPFAADVFFNVLLPLSRWPCATAAHICAEGTLCFYTVHAVQVELSSDGFPVAFGVRASAVVRPELARQQSNGPILHSHSTRPQATVAEGGVVPDDRIAPEWMVKAPRLLKGEAYASGATLNCVNSTGCHFG